MDNGVSRIAGTEFMTVSSLSHPFHRIGPQKVNGIDLDFTRAISQPCLVEGDFGRIVTLLLGEWPDSHCLRQREPLLVSQKEGMIDQIGDVDPAAVVSIPD